MATRKMDRRSFIGVAAAATGGFLTGCVVASPTPSGAESKPAVTEQAAAPAQGKPGEGMYFRLVTHGSDDPFWAVVQQGMRDAADLYGCRAEIDLAKWRSLGKL